MIRERGKSVALALLSEAIERWKMEDGSTIDFVDSTASGNVFFLDEWYRIDPGPVDISTWVLDRIFIPYPEYQDRSLPSTVEHFEINCRGPPSKGVFI